MNILVETFGLGKKIKEIMRDKTPYKIQIMRNALVRREVEFGNHVYSVHVPARLVKNYPIRSCKSKLFLLLLRDLSY